MPMYYALNTDNIKVDESEIGNIMLNEINKYLMKKYGLYLNLQGFTNLDDYCKMAEGLRDGSLEYLTEDIMWSKMDPDEKAGKLTSQLKFNGEKIDELLIIDPYFFKEASTPKATEDYFNLVTRTLQDIKPLKIKIITNRKNVTDSFKKRMEETINVPIHVSLSKEWHDRFWIVNKKRGILMGSSFNGILGSKIFSINPLSQEDLDEIVKYVDKDSSRRPTK